jgi:homoserine dehydrogenase
MKKIIIVESPSKSKTIESYMGDEYKVVASNGHIRDLSTKGKGGLGIDIPAGFIPRYEVLKEKVSKVSELKKQGKVLRMAASIENGKVSVGMIEVDENNPLYGIRGGENAFVFHTARYTPIPMTIRGYGAGAGVTAAGVFGDILRTVSWNPDKL